MNIYSSIENFQFLDIGHRQSLLDNLEKHTIYNKEFNYLKQQMSIMIKEWKNR